ncbi:GNAT family N-acetyltransferase [Sphingomonas sp.]|uniref:GNAT family N-acetyltransferase n=1 Tax=Sphingomonas sp. TaxID=28214 RepID=UPI0033419E52
MTDRHHPLDRPVWNALTTRQADLALGDRHAVRFRPAVNLFAAGADQSPASLAALAGFAADLPDSATMGLVEATPHATVPGTRIVSATPIDQMVLTRLDARNRQVPHVALGAADVPAMLALTALTVPGPFFAETYRQGDYIGVYEAGQLIAMAGQRMRPPGFTEVSAVCTHSDYQGRGLGRALMEAVIAPILAQGEAAFLHCYPDNPARGLYEALGFRYRATMTYTVLSRDNAFSR